MSDSEFEGDHTLTELVELQMQLIDLEEKGASKEETKPLRVKILEKAIGTYSIMPSEFPQAVADQARVLAEEIKASVKGISPEDFINE